MRFRAGPSIGYGSFRQKQEATSWPAASYAAQGIIIMKARIEVVSQAEFDKWYKEKVAAATNASTGKAPGQSK
jgi:hypothetical protein